MVAEFDAFATRMRAPLGGLALLLTGDREAAAALVHTALTTVRTPDERRVIATLVRAWLAGAPPVGEPVELPYDQELLRRALDALSEKQRVAVVLHHWSGLPVPDIAAMLRRPSPAVAADLAAGVAELPDPDEPVATRLAALVAAAGPVPVDLAQVAEAGRAQQRHRRRTAVVAAAALVAAGTVAAMLTGGEPEPAASERTPVRVVERFGAPPPDLDDRARRLTAQLTAAMDDVLPGATEQSGFLLSPPEFAVGIGDGVPDTYVANTTFIQTSLIFIVESRAADAFVPCSEPDQVCTYRQFPDNTVAEVVVGTEPDLPSLSLTSRRPDGTSLLVLAHVMGPPGPPTLGVEDMFRFATVLTY